MSTKTLSIFIDESGDFGKYNFHSPYYLVTMIFHEQSIDIIPNISSLETHIKNLGHETHAIHTGPLIRRESFYKNDSIEMRKALFNALFHFTRKLSIHYLCTLIDKSSLKNKTEITLINKLSKSLSEILKKNYSYISQFTSIIIYYDNGQIELTKILTAVFNSLFTNIEFRRVRPIDYKLFQVADLICTIELLHKKAETNSFSKSETEFFSSPKAFNKNIYKQISQKKL